MFKVEHGKNLHPINVTMTYHINNKKSGHKHNYVLPLLDLIIIP